MTPSLLLYGTVLGLLLAAAAHFLDAGLRRMGRPTRWVWAMGLTSMALVPIGLPFLSGTDPSTPPSGMALPLEALYRMGFSVSTAGSPSDTLGSALDTPILLLWMAASATVLLLISGGALRLHRRSSGWTRTRAGHEEVLISDGVGPAVMGIIRTRIVLPTWVLSLPPEALEMVLLHEAEHRKARDPALLAGGLLMAALVPWSLPLWWSLRRLRLAVEGDCDRRVLARGVRMERYGSLLLDVASGSSGLSSLSPALTEGGGTYLERRLHMMRDSNRGGGFRSASLGLLASGFFLFLACETPTPPQLSEEAVPSGESGPVAGFDAEGRAWLMTDGASLKADSIAFRGPVAISVDPEGTPGEDSPLVFIDDKPVGRGQAAFRDLDPDDIERIEVIKGAAATAVFGDGAKAGVIKVYLKK